MRITPACEFLAAVDIPVGYIHSAQIAYRAVDYAQFAVVAPVDVCTELGERNLKEGLSIDTAFAQLLEETRTDMKRSDMIVDQTYLYPGGCTLGENIGYTEAYIVVLEYIILYIYGMTRRLQILFESREFVLAARKDLYGIVAVILCSGKRTAQIDLLQGFGSESGSENVRPSCRRNLRRLRRDIIRVFLMLRPKKRYKISPTTGSRSRTVTHASDLTGLRFSERMMIIIRSVEIMAIRASTV